jgi:hypothetical protein
MHRFRRRPSLRVEPLRRYAPPAYPTIDLFARYPEKLLDHAPPRWLQGGVTLGALTAFVMAGSGSRAQLPVPPIEAADAPDTAARPAPTAGQRDPAQETFSVAPVFIHGEGRGATGCVVVSPPVFLSEAEALDVIWEELRNEDLGFERRSARVPGFSIERQPANLLAQGLPPALLERLQRAAGPRETKRTTPVFFDAYSPRYRCGVVFVGYANYDELDDTPDTGSWSSVTSYDMAGRAQTLVEHLSEHGRVNAGVFYDPMAELSEDAPAPGGRDTAVAESKEQLRAQVREFVEWLKHTLREAPPTGRP